MISSKDSNGGQCNKDVMRGLGSDINIINNNCDEYDDNYCWSSPIKEKLGLRF